MVRKKARLFKGFIKKAAIVASMAFLFLAGAGLLWVSTFKIPDLSTFDERKVSESTKIYDRTGEILLYDVHENIKRSVVPYTEISTNIKNATVAIEDDEFWQHKGIKPVAFLRAVFVNLQNREFSQGGSTITQQVIKNALLTSEKKISRKLKEWVLALKLERTFSKEQILAIYLNEVPYGGSVYGIQEASQSFFGKDAKDLTIAESAYLSALPNAPTYYSPYGNNRDKLEQRKNFVIHRMKASGFISEEEYQEALKEEVEFKEQQKTGIKAPHFVFFVREYLEKKYGKDAVQSGGFKVITTLDYGLQEKAQELVASFLKDNKERWDAENGAMVSIDPKTGQILVMVGSRDYFDTEIDGNFNVAIAYRQPGSSIKPIVYASAFLKGYTPETVIFDLQTQFSSSCEPHDFSNEYPCYSPKNFTGGFSGPIMMKDALAQSANVPSVKVLYLTGVQNAIYTARDLGITSLNDPSRLGLSLVLGGGEVSPLDMASAYSVFANGGKRNPATSILRVETPDGKILEEFKQDERQVIPEQITLQISAILSDSQARAPVFGRVNQYMVIPGHDVAIKTGTTNDVRDLWVLGYTKNLATGLWVGNNDNRPIGKASSASILPLWHAYMTEALKTKDTEAFPEPSPSKTEDLKPILRGIWKGGDVYYIDAYTGGLATEHTPQELKQEKVLTSVHSILNWIDKDNPQGDSPTNPGNDSQYANWEYPVRLWAIQNGYMDETPDIIPGARDDIRNPSNIRDVSIITPIANTPHLANDRITVSINYDGVYPLQKFEVFINGAYIGEAKNINPLFSFTPINIPNISGTNILKVIAYDEFLNSKEASIDFTVSGI
ncbi:MAG: transglycosylase domain-containing protein [bacterium]|nr:transglycosylase domain-containing protein [bacterium]